MKIYFVSIALLVSCVGAVAAGDGASKEPGYRQMRPGVPVTPMIGAPEKSDTKGAMTPLKPAAPVPIPMTAVPMSPGCADPAVDLSVQLLSKTSATQGRIRITAIVKNVGQVAWAATSYTHHLSGLLTSKYNEQNYNGQPLEPAQKINGLGVGQQVALTHEMNWTAQQNALYPKFIVRVSEAGQADYSKTPQEKLNCRTDNDRKEIGPGEVNILFGDIPPPSAPVTIQSYKTEFGVVIASIHYNRAAEGSARINGSVEPPHSGKGAELSVLGKTGTVNLRVGVTCATKGEGKGEKSIGGKALVKADGVKLSYGLSESLSGGPLGSSWVPVGVVSHVVPYAQICDDSMAPSGLSAPKPQY